MVAATVILAALLVYGSVLVAVCTEDEIVDSLRLTGYLLGSLFALWFTVSLLGFLYFVLTRGSFPVPR